MDINTTIARHAAGLFTIGAVAALAAGCGAGPSPADGPAAGAGAGQADVHVAAGADDEQIKTVESDASDTAKSKDTAKGTDTAKDKGATKDEGTTRDQGATTDPGTSHGADRGKGQSQTDKGATPGDDHGKAGDDHGKAGEDHGKAGDGDDQGGGDETAPPTAELPDSWAGTVSTERFAPGDATAYLAMVAMHGDRAATSMTAEQIENTEFLGGMDAQCEGDVDLDGAFSSCTFVDPYGDGETMFAQVRLVPMGFGNTGLLFGVSGEAATDLAVAPGVALGLQSVEQDDLSAVTAESLEGAAIGGVMIGYRIDGDVPAGISATCEVTEGGEHGVCEVTGTPDGGGDGTWYATAQRGYSGDTDAYVFTMLPQE